MKHFSQNGINSLIFFYTFFFLMVTPTQTYAQGSCAMQITVTVRDENTDLPLPDTNALVIFQGDTLDSGITDVNGVFVAQWIRTCHDTQVLGYTVSVNKSSCESESAIEPLGKNYGYTGAVNMGLDCIAPNPITVTPTPTPTPLPPGTYSIRGRVFIDTNQNKKQDSGEKTYSPITISSTGGNVSYPAPGEYLISNLSQGTYTVSYRSLPNGYSMVYPKGSPPSFLATVGPTCNVDTTTGAQCSESITNLNFAIVSTKPWMQFRGSDARFDYGLLNPIPAATMCGDGYTMIPNSSATHGVFFSGNTNSDFGIGDVSLQGWIVGGTSHPEMYSPPSSGIRRTSYDYIQTTLRQSAITPITLTTGHCGPGGINNCMLQNNLPNGVYQVNGNLRLINPSYTFAANRDFVFLIRDNLYLGGQIRIPVGTTATFSVGKNIRIAKDVGTTPACSPPISISGFYSADQDIVFEGINNCSIGDDLMLGLEGSFIANAGNEGGRISMQRNLCARNREFPAVSIRDRPDFILNAPEIIKVQTYNFKEISP